MKILCLILIAAMLTVTVSAADTGEISEIVLASYIEGAAGGLPLSVMSGVGAVFVNRWKSDRYPDSVALNGASLGVLPSPTPSDMAKYAARLALSGFDPTDGAVYFYSVHSEKRRDHRDLETYVSSGMCFALG